MKQLIIARKDLHMSPGKLATQVSHASMAFITWPMRQARLQIENVRSKSYDISFKMSGDIMDDWICGSFTKVVCEAKNRYQLAKIVSFARELGLKEEKDFFLIKDNCLTELTPEEVDENGVGRTLTCIGFRPLPDVVHQLSKKYQLYR